VGKHHAKNPDEVARAVDALRDYGIFVHGNFIIGLPGETAGTAAETLAGLTRIRFDSIGGGPFFLTPGSVGGDTADLVRLWQQPDSELSADERMVVDVLKEKTGRALPAQAAAFVGTARQVASGAHAKAVAS
jgi:hypothetical protein